MRIAIAGGTGLIGGLVARALDAAGHDVLPFSPRTGVDTVTGAGLDEALEGADVVIDVTRPHTYADAEVREFFRASSTNIARAAVEASVDHLLTLSAVGIDRAPDIGFYVAKVRQEEIVRYSGVPFTLVRATQFFEFAEDVADSATRDGTVRVSVADMQPIAAVDVAAALADLATAAPAGGVVELGGPERMPIGELVRRVLQANDDPRAVVIDPDATYFGGRLDSDTLIPGPDARLGDTTLEQWLAASTI